MLGTRPSVVDSWKPWRTLLPLVVVGGACAILSIAIWILCDSAHAGTSPVPPPPSAAASIDFVKERLELYDRRARDLQWLLAALLATGALFTLLQGVFAFFSVQNFNAQAEAGLHRAEEEVRRQFPIASKMEEALDEALRLLEIHFQDANWYEKLYHDLRDDKRQEILFYEKVIAGFTSLNVPKLAKRLGRSFRGLGCFYTSKFLDAGGRRLRPGDELGQWVARQAQDDLERARFYLRLAIKRNDQDFAAMNMLGYIALECLRPPDPDEARWQFRSSHDIQPNQQRAHFNLANIAYNIDHDHNAAIGFYREALVADQWEHDPRPENVFYIKLNLACVLACKWHLEHTAASAEEALGLLDEIMRTRRDIVSEFLEKECSGEGDLVPLLSHPQYAARLNAIRAL